MRRLVMMVTLACALSVAALAGEVPTGGVAPPPPQAVPGEVPTGGVAGEVPTGGGPEQIAQGSVVTILVAMIIGFPR